MASRRSYIRGIVCILPACVFLVGNVPASIPQDKPESSKLDRKDLVKKCQPVIVKKPKTKQKTIQVHDRDKSTGFSPIIAFQIAESGEVINVHVKRSSGIRDIDVSALSFVQSSKYNSRAGCPIVDSETNVLIDFSAASR